MVDAHRPWQHEKVTDQRTGQDFAACMRDLVDQHYPRAKRIRVILDNLDAPSLSASAVRIRRSQGRRMNRSKSTC